LYIDTAQRAFKYIKDKSPEKVKMGFTMLNIQIGASKKEGFLKLAMEI
jgi:hypothetical protein